MEKLIELAPDCWVRPSDVRQLNLRHGCEVWATLACGQGLRVVHHPRPDDARRELHRIVALVNGAANAQARPAN